MDVDHMSSIRVNKNNNRERWVAFNRAIGARMSAMEHLVPEEMYSADDNPAHGISAVKALQLAAAEGQKIWTVTQSNLNQAMAALNLSSAVEADIRNAVRTGKEVSAHEDTINFHGRPSAGYMVIDPETGAGGYLIAGGENGGVISAEKRDDLRTVSFFYELLATATGLIENARLASLIGQVLTLIDVVDRCEPDDARDIIIGATLLSLLSIFFSALLATVLGLVGAVVVFLAISYMQNLILSSAISARRGCT